MNRAEDSEPRRLRMTRGEPERAPVRRIDYESELNDEQLAAVSAPGGPVIVLAGAGSGKTRVITYRVAYLVEEGIRPGNILLTTFTNRAARAMLGRVENLLGISLSAMMGGTFHHISNVMLRKYAPLIGFTENFTILDEGDSVSLMRRVRGAAKVDFSGKLFPAPRVLKRIASLLVNKEITLDDLIIREYPHFAERILDIERIIGTYTTEKARQDLMDYDDLLLWTHYLITEHEGAKAEIAGRYEHVLVDEYQDTNHLQAKLVELWSSEHGNLFVVGDDAQSIYSFRGANYKNILEFPERFPEARTYKLETNYRSTPGILELANEVIKNTPEHFRKTLRPVKPSGGRPALVICKTPDDQAEFVAERILEYREEGIGLNDIGVLYRAHRNSQEIEMTLARRGIPYFIRGGVRFMEMAHIKDILSYLVVLGAPRNELAWVRLLSMCDGVGQKTIEKILKRLRESGDPLREFIKGNASELAYGRGKESADSLAKFLKDLIEEGGNLDPAPTARLVFKHRYEAYLKSEYDNAARRAEDIEQFIIFASRFGSIGEMLEEVALHGGFFGEEVSALDPAAVEEGRVCLSTIHQAKGLEWKAVFVVWCVEGNLPHSMSYDDPDSLEEERRLFYVAITRAKDELILTYPQEREFSDFRINITFPTRYLRDARKGAYDEFILEWDEPGSERVETAIAEGPDMEKLGGRMLSGSDPAKSGGVWMPDVPAPIDAHEE